MRWRLQQGRGPSSWAIGWFGGGGWSHIDVFTPEGKLRGARSDVWGSVPAGYRDRPDNYDSNIVKYCVVSLLTTPAQEKAYWEFSDRCLGAPYDKRGILGFATGDRNFASKHDPDGDANPWFCSEQVQANCEYAKIFFPIGGDFQKVDPGDNYFEFAQRGAAFQTTLMSIQHG